LRGRKARHQGLSGKKKDAPKKNARPTQPIQVLEKDGELGTPSLDLRERKRGTFCPIPKNNHNLKIKSHVIFVQRLPPHNEDIEDVVDAGPVLVSSINIGKFCLNLAEGHLLSG